MNYNLKWTFLDYLRIRLAIPLFWRQLLSNNVENNISNTTLYDKLNNFKTLKTKTLYWLLLEQKYDMCSKPKAQIYWEGKYDIPTECFGDIYNLPYKVIRLTNVQSMQYKVLYRILNCNSWLYKIKIINSPVCRFCDKEENFEHYLFDCKVTKEYWSAFLTWWNTHDIPTLES